MVQAGDTRGRCLFLVFLLFVFFFKKVPLTCSPFIQPQNILLSFDMSPEESRCLQGQDADVPVQGDQGHPGHLVLPRSSMFQADVRGVQSPGPFAGPRRK